MAVFDFRLCATDPPTYEGRTSMNKRSKFKKVPAFGEKKSPILLQDYGNPVDFRNVRIRLLK